MANRDKSSIKTSLAQALEADLLQHYGPILSGESLRRALGYPSMAAMRQAVLRGTVPVPIFPLQHRRGKFALVKDVAMWLAEQHNGVDSEENSSSKDYS